ncbi:class I SAM-dependent methyltransferase [Streptomyces sp. 6N223]|uniref:class I SAM-dependent methyltransferase n=1 Tax=Streptomyces sp. 6N223 TaxID=3457412 RepID=UPI003FD394C9
MSGQSAAIADFWNAAASSFDEEPDHGLRADSTRGAWADLLRSCMPAPPAEVLDVGCGTGSLSLLLAQAGHRVTGVDLSSEMIEKARAKLAAARAEARLLVGDAARPPTGGRLFDVVLCRHLVWTLPDPEATLRRWVGLLREGGRLVLVEGQWRREAGEGGEAGESARPYVAGAGADALPWLGGISAADLAACVRPLVADLRVESLSGIPELWGGPVADERYIVIGEIASAPMRSRTARW